MIEGDDNPYCRPHYEERYLPRCAKCNNIATGECMTVLNKTYHPYCLVCVKCNIRLLPSAQIFLDSNKQLTCRNCI